MRGCWTSLCLLGRVARLSIRGCSGTAREVRTGVPLMTGFRGEGNRTSQTGLRGADGGPPISKQMRTTAPGVYVSRLSPRNKRSNRDERGTWSSRHPASRCCVCRPDPRSPDDDDRAEGRPREHRGQRRPHDGRRPPVSDESNAQHRGGPVTTTEPRDTEVSNPGAAPASQSPLVDPYPAPRPMELTGRRPLRPSRLP